MENTIKKTSLRGKTHFDVSSSIWTPTMMLRYIEFQESYNDGWLVLSEDSLLNFAYLHEATEKQQKTFFFNTFLSLPLHLQNHFKP